MIFFIYSIHDSKAEAFMNPFFKPTRAMAQRDFELAINDEASMMSKTPADFSLFELGQFDADTGEIQPMLQTMVQNGNEVRHAEDSNGPQLLRGAEG